MLVDTHAHIHSDDYALAAETVIAEALAVEVKSIVCVGTSVKDSQQAIKFAQSHSVCVATIGLHPHEAKAGPSAWKKLATLIQNPQVVAVGECGLDYFYNYSPAQDQAAALRYQIELAQAHHKPLVFHVREAFADFFKIIDSYRDIQGVVHSFTADTNILSQVLDRGLYVALNGIMTFTKDAQQLVMAKAVPSARLLLETDSPFLTPAPNRGKVNRPANVRLVAQFLAELRGESFNQLAQVTTSNAVNLFKLDI